MLPTPSTSHVDFDQVYEPAEDSFLLLDTLSSDSESAFLARRFGQEPDTDFRLACGSAPLIVEVGTGSGVVLAFITAHSQKILGATNVITLGIDINPFACKVTRQTVLQACRENPSIGDGFNGGHRNLVACLNADLSSCLRHDTVDLLIFNPPYVPTAQVPKLPFANDTNKLDVLDDLDGEFNLLSLSYAGGEHGMEVTNRLLDELPSLLSKARGVAYLLLCKQNKPKQVVERVEKWGTGWSVKIVGYSGKTGGWEKLQILRICRMNIS